MLPVPQPILIRNNSVHLATLADSALLPVLLEQGEQPFFEWFSSLDMMISEESMFKKSELHFIGGTKMYASGQCLYLDGYDFITAAFDNLWKKALQETKLLRATHFVSSPVLG